MNSPLLPTDEIVRRLRIVKARPTVANLARHAGITEGYLHRLAIGDRILSVGSPAHRKLSAILASQESLTEY